MQDTAGLTGLAGVPEALAIGKVAFSLKQRVKAERHMESYGKEHAPQRRSEHSEGKGKRSTTTIFSGVTWVKKKDEVRASVRPKSLP